jgi:hypothetical protein
VQSNDQSDNGAVKRFVVQKHTRTGEPVHWDLMLEGQDALETYRLDRPPETLAGGACSASRIFDHELRFLTYEGPVNQGQGRVEIVDRGTYTLVLDQPGRRELSLDGELFDGLFAFVRLKGKSWRFERLTKGEVDSKS